MRIDGLETMFFLIVFVVCFCCCCYITSTLDQSFLSILFRVSFSDFLKFVLIIAAFQLFHFALDVGYLNNESYKVLQPTAWIPLLDANEENGCLQVQNGIY